MNVKNRDRMITHLMNFAAFKGCVPKVESYNCRGGYIVSYQLARITTFEFWKNGYCFTWTIDWINENKDGFEDSTLRNIKTCFIAWLERVDKKDKKDKKERNMKEEKRTVVLDVLRGFAFDNKLTLDYMYHTGDKETVLYFKKNYTKYSRITIVWAEESNVYELIKNITGLVHSELIDISSGNFMEKNFNLPKSIKDYIDTDIAMTKQLINSVYGRNAFKGGIKNVIFNDPATIVFWNDGSKTVVKAQDGDEFDPEKGLAMAISKKVLGNKYDYYNTFSRWLKKWEKQAWEKHVEEVANTPLATDGLLLGYSKEQWDYMNERLVESLTKRISTTPGEE